VASAIAILRQVESLDDDPAPGEQRNPVFTMPLPRLVRGDWGNLATHPRLQRREEQADEPARTDLLLRYLDFTVKPANCYRYRVRLVWKNPNYGRQADVIAPFVAEGQYRYTDWSEPSPVVRVER
jgi:hypothetical protein